VEEVFSFWLKMPPIAQGVGQKLLFCHNFGSIQLFFNLFSALVLCYQHVNLMEEKFFEKIIVGGLFLICFVSTAYFYFFKNFSSIKFAC
jgi:hypothetical protein